MASSGSIAAGAYNDARVKRGGDSIVVTQNPAMFIVLTVLAGGSGSVLFFLGGTGRMTLNGVGVPPAAAGVIGMIAGGVLGALGLVCLIQAFHPGALILEPASRRYTRHGGVVGKLLNKGARSGSFGDFQKLRVNHCRNTNPSGQSVEYWRLTICWKDGLEQNLGCYTAADRASSQAEGFANALGIPVERIEGGS